MTLVEGILVVIIILLTIYILYPQPACTGYDDYVDDKVTTIKVRTVGESYSPEKISMRDNAEYFSSTNNESDDTTAVVADSNGMSYNDYMMNQAVDPAVKSNHTAFVADMLGDSTKNVTGATYAMGEVEGTDQIPWIGIRGRPVAIPTSASAGALQVPDVDPNAFATKSRFNWTSS